jgi:hypothetical protein
MTPHEKVLWWATNHRLPLRKAALHRAKQSGDTAAIEAEKRRLKTQKREIAHCMQHTAPAISAGAESISRGRHRA